MTPCVLVELACWLQYTSSDTYGANDWQMHDSSPLFNSKFRCCSDLELRRRDGWVDVRPCYILPKSSAALQKNHAPSSINWDSISASGWEQDGVSPLLPPQSAPPVPAHSPPLRPRSLLLPPTPPLVLPLPGSGMGAELAPAPSGLVVCHGRDRVV